MFHRGVFCCSNYVLNPLIHFIPIVDNKIESLMSAQYVDLMLWVQKSASHGKEWSLYCCVIEVDTHAMNALVFASSNDMVAL